MSGAQRRGSVIGRRVVLATALAAALTGLAPTKAGADPPFVPGGTNAPTIAFVSPPSPTEGATSTTSSVRFVFNYNRKVQQTQALICILQGPTPASGPCEIPAPTALANWSQSGISYSGLANGAYTMNVRLTLTDGGATLAVRRFTINQAPPPPQATTLTVQAVPPSLGVGGLGHATAALAGANAASAGGSVTYALYSDAGCTQPVTGAGGQVAVTGGGVPDSADFTFTSVGTFHWQASYSGDALNLPSASPCNDPANTVTVTAPTPQATTLTVHAVPQDLGVGGLGHATATLSGANAASAGGTVTYALYSNASCSQAVPGAGGQVAVTGGSVPDSTDFTFTSVGTFHWQASYSGDALNLPSASPCNDPSQTVIVTPTTTPSTNPLAAGDFHTCIITSAIGVKCWGSNVYGALGDGTSTDSNVPIDVSALGNGVISIAAGGYHTCALVSMGAVKCWGRNDDGQLGNGSNTNSNVPIDVSGLGSGVIALTGGDFHTCALTSGGGVKCWGSNAYGALGDGTFESRNVPVDVSGLASGVVAIAAGGYHTCALTNLGAVKCWGHGERGQLGDGSGTISTVPVDVVGLASGASAISGGYYHTCALTTAGGVKCWGYNLHGQLGNGANTNSTTPVDVSGLESGVSAVSANGFHSCALTSTGGAKCWGAGGDGAIGNGENANSNVPVDVEGLTTGVTIIAAGAFHTCGVTGASGTKCWGANGSGQLGNGTNTPSNKPVAVLL